MSGTAASSGDLPQARPVMMASGSSLASAMRVDGVELRFQQRQPVNVQVLVAIGGHGQRQFCWTV